MQGGSLTILQVSPSDHGGGAERVALDLHRGYLKRHLDAWLALGANYERTPNTLQIHNIRYRSRWAQSVLGLAALADPANDHGLPAPIRQGARFVAEPSRYRRVLGGLEDFDAPGTSHLLKITPRTPDVLHLHNLHGSYFDVRELPRLSAAVPTILTLHDAWALTGHCAHPIDCQGYLSGCAQCPALDRYVPIRRDAADENFRIKRTALKGGSLHVATPSQWLAGLVEGAGVDVDLAELRVIPNGIDATVFTPGDSIEARMSLGLPENAFVIAFGATNTAANEFKGFATLEVALARIASALQGREVILLAIGHAAPEFRVGGATVRFVPFVDKPEDLATYYRAADLYLHPARAESFGLTILEAMSCGTPVVASDVGGIPEVVVAGQTGLLVPPGDASALADATVALVNDEQRRAAFSAAGVLRASEFTFARQADTYLDWYGELSERL